MFYDLGKHQLNPYSCSKSSVIFEKITPFHFRLNRPSKPGFFTFVGFLKAILKTLEGCEISGG